MSITVAPKTDDQLLTQFEECTLPAQEFHHIDHIRVAWIYLHRYSVLETLGRFAQALKRFAAANGKANLYHETITWAYVFLIHERLQRDGFQQTWTEFAQSNRDLLDWNNSSLHHYYRHDTLWSDLARKIFILPDKLNSTP